MNGQKTGFPLLNRGSQRAVDGIEIHEIALDPISDPFLNQHRLDDRPLLPLVIGLELIAEAANHLFRDKQVVALHDVRALHGLKFHTDRRHSVRVRSKSSTTEFPECQLVADFLARNGQLVESDRVHLEGRIELADKPWVDNVSLEVLRGLETSGTGSASASWEPIQYPAKGSKFYSGPALQCLRKILMEEPSAWGKIAAPALVELVGSRHAVDGWLIPSAALDACLFATGVLAWKRIRPSPALPARIGTLRLGRLPRPGETCWAQIQFRGWSDVQARFDFRLFGDDGRVLIDVQDYCIAWVG